MYFFFPEAHENSVPVGVYADCSENKRESQNMGDQSMKAKVSFEKKSRCSTKQHKIKITALLAYGFLQEWENVHTQNK